ncbi:MAG: prepilin-type N-terminal cleavage/methylation domain-containing protein [Thiohalocapsa sp.]
MNAPRSEVPGANTGFRRSTKTRRSQTRLFRRSKRSAGFSLVELMVAVTIGAMLMIGLTDLLVDSKTVYVREDQFARLQENARVATLVASRSLRTNRSLGCRSIAMAEFEGQFTVKACDLLDTKSGDDCSHADWKSDRHFLSMDRAIGYDNADDLDSAADYPDLPSAAAENISNRWLRGDVLVTWGVDEQGASLTGTLGSAIGEGGGFQGTGALGVDPVPSALGNVGRLALVTDCMSADLFEVSGPEDLDTGDSSIEHSATNPDGVVVNASDALGHAYNWTASASGDRQTAAPIYRANVFPFSYDVYYVCCVDTGGRRIQTGARVDRCRVDPGHRYYDRFRPALCAWSMEDASSQALLSDVADMRVTYTGDLDNDGTIDFASEDSEPVPNAAWVSRNNAWSGVRSAALELLVTTEASGVATERKAPARDHWPPNAGDGSIASDTLGKDLPADDRLYQRFLINVAMRSRTPWYVSQ